MVRRGVLGLLLLALVALFMSIAQVRAQPRASMERIEKPAKNLWVVAPRTRIATPDGALVVYDAPRAEDSSQVQVGYLAYWNDFATGKVYVFARLIQERSDLMDALRCLRHDFGIDPHDLAPDVFAEAYSDPARVTLSNPADVPTPVQWFPATRARVMEIAGLWSPEDVDPSVPPVVAAPPIPPPCLPCYSATAGGDVAPLDAGDPYAAAIAAACNCCYHPVCPNCDDGTACTRDYCQIDCTLAYCVHLPINCDDGLRCTTDGCNRGSGCYHINENCDDGIPCTTDRCDPASGGCEYVPRCPNPDRPQCCYYGENEVACCMADQVCCRYRWAGEGHPDNGCCPPNTTCCGAGCCQPDETCCNGQCGKKGACCSDTGSCSELTEVCCAQQGGTYQGDGITCSPGDLCRPKCENCHTVSAVLYECEHHTLDPTEPCSTTQCIVNTINTASCDRFPNRRGPGNCNTKTLTTGTWVVQEVRTLVDTSCANYWPGDFHVWMTPVYGCETVCIPSAPIGTRCDTFGCEGNLEVTYTRTPGRACGCP